MRTNHRFLVATLSALIIVFGGASTAFATATVTTLANASISADTTGGSFTPLTGPVVSEGATADVKTGTIILNAPSGFVFDTGGTAATVLVTRIAGSGANNRNINDLASGSTIAVTQTSDTLTITITASTSNGVRNSLTWQNVRVRPSAGTPLASGNITKSSSSTAAITGITNGSTNFGTLTEVAGTATKLAFTTHPGSATYGSVLSTQPVVQSQDQFNNPSVAGLGASKMVTLTLSSGTGSLQGTSALDIGTGAGNGTVTFSGLSVNAAGSGKVLTAAAASLTSAISNAFTINQLAAVLTGTRVYDMTASVSYSILSVSNKVGTDDVTVASGSGTLANANAGAQSIISFGTIALGGTTAGNYTLTGASGTVTITAASQTITFNPLSNKSLGDPDFLVSATASSGLTVSFASLTPSVCTVSTATVHLVAVGTCTLQASQAGNSNYTAAMPVDQSFSVLPAAVKFVILPPGSGTVGTPVTVTVQAQKSDNSVDTTYQNDVTLNASGSATGAGLVDIINGVGTLAISDTHAETVTLSLTDSEGTGLDVSSTQSLSFAAGAVASFTLSDPGDMYAKTRLGYTVSRFDTYGNAVGTGTTTVYLYTSSTGGTQKFYNDSLNGSVITSIDIGPGHSTANVWYYDETPGTYTITASDNASAPDGVDGVDDATDSVTVMPVAVKFVILQPSNGTVDAPIMVTVQAQKPDNSVDTNYQNDVTLNASGSATGAGLVDIINGVGTLAISDTHAETVTLSLTDSEGTGLDVSSTRSVVFVVGALSQFTLTHPGSLSAGQRAAYTITREDQYGNATTAATTTVYLYSTSTDSNKRFYSAASGGSVITSVQIPDGQSSADVWYYDTVPGAWTIAASDNASNDDGNTGVNDAYDSLQVTAGPVTRFLLSDPGDMTAGTLLGYAVTRKDQFNNLVTSGATTVYLYSNSIGTTSPAFYDAASGGAIITSLSILDGQSSKEFWYLDPNPGTWEVTASDATPIADGSTGVSDANDTVAVSAAPIVPTRFVILPPASGTVDAPITVTVQVQDGSGNLDTTYQSDVTLNASGSATGAGLVDIINGVGTKSISDMHVETVTLSLTDSEGTGLGVTSTETATFAPGAVAQLSLTNPGDTAAGLRIGYTVARADRYGNAVTAGATTVLLSSTTDGVNSKFYDAASGGSAITSIVIPDGSSSIGFWAYDEKAGNWFISVNGTGITGATDPITIQPAAVAKFTLNDPGNMTEGTRLGYAVTRKDQFNNLVMTGVTLAYLYSSSTGTTTAFYATDTGGAPTTFATINDGSSTGNFWYYDGTPGTWLVTASDSSTYPPNGSVGVIDATDAVTVSAIPIVATRFVILPPRSVQVDTLATVTVQAQDDTGNIDTTIQSGVTLQATGSATGAGLVTVTNGVGTIQLSDTIVETVTLSLIDSQGTGLDVSSTRNLTFSATPAAPPLGSAPGAAEPAPVIAGVQLSGLAFPNANVQVLAVSSLGTALKGQATANANGAFSLLLKDIGVGVGSYGVVGIDELGRTTQTKVFNANYTSSNAFLSLDTELSPTLGLVHTTVRKNDIVGLVGYAVPGYIVSAQIDGKAIAPTAVAGADGSYKILFSTAPLALGSHTARVRQTSPSGVRSDFAPQRVFTVTTLFTPQTDFNQDGTINVQDWSIFLSRWSSPRKATQLLDDLNGDRKVDVTDLSIFVRTLKK